MDGAKTVRRVHGSVRDRLDEAFGDRACDWSMPNRVVVDATGFGKSTVSYWRRGRIRDHVARGGEPPVCACGKPFMHMGTCATASRPARKPRCRPVGIRSLLDSRYGDRACDWTITNSEIARDLGISGPNVVPWRRMHLNAWVAENGSHPDCTCGLPFMHVLACTEVDRDRRSECERMIGDDVDLHAVASRTGLPYGAVVSLTVHVLGMAAARPRLEQARARRKARSAFAPVARRYADDAHLAISKAIGDRHQESEDAVQEAYLAMLERGLDVAEAVRTGRTAANRMANVRWGALSLDAPLGDDGHTTMLDLRADDSALDAFDAVLERLDLEAQGDDAEWERFSAVFDMVQTVEVEPPAEDGGSDEETPSVEADRTVENTHVVDGSNVVPMWTRREDSVPHSAVSTEEPAPARRRAVDLTDDELVALVETAARHRAEEVMLRRWIEAATSEADRHRRRAEDAEKALSDVSDLMSTQAAMRLAA